MVSLYLSDILKRNGLNSSRVKLIRHSLKQERCRLCHKSGFIDEYQKIQNKNLYKNCDYILSFINEPGTSAKFIGCYSVGSGIPITSSLMPQGFPIPEMYENEEDYYFDLRPVEILSDLKERLIINWGKATVSWHQWATNDKEVIAIQANPKYTFCGYENMILSFNDLKEIINDKVLYENWHEALSSVNAIYLITDTSTGKQYVGSAYGAGGLLGRWSCYVSNGHGNNLGIVDILAESESQLEQFQFSILQILPKTLISEDVIELENLYKKKLLTKVYGMNQN